MLTKKVQLGILHPRLIEKHTVRLHLLLYPRYKKQNDSEL